MCTDTCMIKKDNGSIRRFVLFMRLPPFRKSNDNQPTAVSLAHSFSAFNFSAFISKDITAAPAFNFCLPYHLSLQKLFQQSIKCTEANMDSLMSHGNSLRVRFSICEKITCLYPNQPPKMHKNMPVFLYTKKPVVYRRISRHFPSTGHKFFYIYPNRRI